MVGVIATTLENLAQPAGARIAPDAINHFLTINWPPSPRGRSSDGATVCREMRCKPRQTCYRRSL
jgi:hypothetical protein